MERHAEQLLTDICSLFVVVCFCRSCRKHTPHKVTQYKTGKASLFAQGKRRYDRKQASDEHCGHSQIRVLIIDPQFAVRIRWSDKARLPQEGKDDKEGRATTRMQFVQVQVAIALEAMQALRARR